MESLNASEREQTDLTGGFAGSLGSKLRGHKGTDLACSSDRHSFTAHVLSACVSPLKFFEFLLAVRKRSLLSAGFLPPQTMFLNVSTLPFRLRSIEGQIKRKKQRGTSNRQEHCGSVFSPALLLSTDLTRGVVIPDGVENTSLLFLWLCFKWLPCVLGVFQVYLYKMQSFCVHKQVPLPSSAAPLGLIKTNV